MSSKKILCICPNPSVDTFAVIHTLDKQTSNKFEKERHYAGGKGIHVAMAIRELGENPEVAGIWAGATGDWIKAELQKLSITTHGIEVSGMNRMSYTFKSNSDWNETEITGAGPEITQQDYEEFLNHTKNILHDYALVVMSGSWPNGAPEDAYARLIKVCNDADKKAFLDCNGEQLKNALPAQPFLLHVNKREADEIFSAENEKNAEQFFLQYVNVVALTEGAGGLYLSDKEKTFHTSCKLEIILSAVGSGDCLTAGLAVSYLRNENLSSMAKYACACGSANCLREELGMLYKKDVDELLHRVVCEEIK